MLPVLEENLAAPYRAQLRFYPRIGLVALCQDNGSVRKVIDFLFVVSTWHDDFTFIDAVGFIGYVNSIAVVITL